MDNCPATAAIQAPDAASAPEDDAAPSTGAWGPIVAGFVPLAIGVLGAQQSVALGLGSLTSPGPGLWPFCLCLILVTLSTGLLLGRNRFGESEAFTRGALLVALGAATVAAFVMVLPLVGFEIPGIVVLALWLKVLGRESWLITAVVPVGTVALFHLLFIELLGVPIPHLIAF